MSLYLWWMDRKFHRLFVKNKTRPMLNHLPPHKVQFRGRRKDGYREVPSLLLQDRKVFYTNRCVCHLMRLKSDDQMIAWPYRTTKGRVGVSWYHPEELDVASGS